MYSRSTPFDEYLQGEQKKYPELTLESIEKLKESLANEEKLPPISDKKYLAFLHSCYFDLEMAKKTIIRCYRFYLGIPEVFCELDPLDEDSEKNYKCSSISQMPTVNTDKGDRILYLQFKDYSPEAFEYIRVFKYLVMWMEYTLLTYGTFDGLIVVMDSKGLNWRHILKLPLGLSSKLLKFLQVALPIRLKKIHILNTGSSTQMLMKMVTQIADKELIDKIQLHAVDSEDIFNHVPRKIMPAEIGGLGKSHNFYNDEMYSNIVAMQDVFLEQNEVLFNQKMYINQQSILDNE